MKVDDIGLNEMLPTECGVVKRGRGGGLIRR